MSVRRASKGITLVLIGTAALAGCSDRPQNLVRDQYMSLEDCTADWGAPQSCGRDATRDGGSPLFFYGPGYLGGNRNVAQAEARGEARSNGYTNRSLVADSSPSNRAVGRVVTPMSSASTARGGFGSSGRVFGASGG